jgi:hypothetical protein
MKNLGYSKNLHIDIPPQQTSFLPKQPVRFQERNRVHPSFHPPMVVNLFDTDDDEGFAK